MAGRYPKDPFGIIGYRATEDGERQPIRVIDRVEEALRANAFLHDAAARVGLSRETLRQWRTLGNRCKAQLIDGTRRRKDLTLHEFRCIELADRMERAEADAKLELLDVVTASAHGGLVLRKTVEVVNAAGEVLSRREEIAHTLPDIKAATWLLSHRYPADFAGRLEITGADGGPLVDVASPVDRLVAAIERARRRMDGELSPNGEVGAASGNGPASPP